MSKFFIVEPGILKFGMPIQNTIPQLLFSSEKNRNFREFSSLSFPKAFKIESYGFLFLFYWISITFCTHAITKILHFVLVFSLYSKISKFFFFENCWLKVRHRKTLRSKFKILVLEFVEGVMLNRIKRARAV